MFILIPISDRNFPIFCTLCHICYLDFFLFYNSYKHNVNKNVLFRHKYESSHYEQLKVFGFYDVIGDEFLCIVDDQLCIL
jgi:hypothetical protein